MMHVKRLFILASLVAVAVIGPMALLAVAYFLIASDTAENAT